MNFQAFLNTLPVVLYGMLGIFIVMAILFAAIIVLGKLFKDK